MRLGESSLLLQFPSKPQLLSGHDALVLGLDLVAITRELVALLGLGPETLNGEAVVEVCAEVVHDSDGEHDIRAELMRKSL